MAGSFDWVDQCHSQIYEPKFKSGNNTNLFIFFFLGLKYSSQVTWINFTLPSCFVNSNKACIS